MTRVPGANDPHSGKSEAYANMVIRKKVEAIGGVDLQPVTRAPVREPGALPLLGAE